MEEASEVLQNLENHINGKKYFGGNVIGYVDIVARVVGYWLPMLLEVANMELLTREKYPGIYAWIDELLGSPIIKDTLPPSEKLRDSLARMYQARFSFTGGSATA